jgi:hypothetical protein
MAKKPISRSSSSSRSSSRSSSNIKPLKNGPARSAAAPLASTSVRNTAVPKAQPARRVEVTHEQIAQRAYEIHLSGQGGSETDNWLRAERELRGS